MYINSQVVDNAMKVYKGTLSDVDSYSVFYDNKKSTKTSLCTQLSELNVTDIYVCGLAYDVCVGNYILFLIIIYYMFCSYVRLQPLLYISGLYLISGATAADALSIGYRTIVIDDCCRGVDLNDIEKTKNDFIKNHGVIVQSNEVIKNKISLLYNFIITKYFIFQIKAMVEGCDRRPELGYKLALEIEKSMKKDLI